MHHHSSIKCDAVVHPVMHSLVADLWDPRLYVLVGVVSLLHATHFAGETAGPRAELWFVAGLGWLGGAALLRRRRATSVD
jgi:hypothetical protein